MHLPVPTQGMGTGTEEKPGGVFLDSVRGWRQGGKEGLFGPGRGMQGTCPHPIGSRDRAVSGTLPLGLPEPGRWPRTQPVPRR